MEDIIASILSGGSYAWLAAALVMVILEIAVPSNWLLWPGLAAFITSIALYFLPGMPWTSAAVVFVALSVILLILGRRYVRLARGGKTDAPNLNARAARMVGRRGAAVMDGSEGMSRVQIDGVEWPVRLEAPSPIKTGEVLEITGFDGTTLIGKIIKI